MVPIAHISSYWLNLPEIQVRGLDVYVEEKDFEELQTIKAGELPRSSSYDNFQSISTKNLDTEFNGVIEKIKVWKIGKISLLSLLLMICSIRSVSVEKISTAFCFLDNI